MSKGILKDREFHSSDGIEVGVTKIWNDLTFDKVQSVFRNWINRLAWVPENGGSIFENKREFPRSNFAKVEIGRRPEGFFTPCIIFKILALMT
jgi:hypothetical protein